MHPPRPGRPDKRRVNATGDGGVGAASAAAVAPAAAMVATAWNRADHAGAEA